MISRRTFLKGALAASVPFALGSGGLVGGARAGGGTAQVVEVSGDPEPALKLLLDLLGGIERFVKPGSRVLLKPNMSFPNPPAAAATTSPGLVSAMARHCLAAGAKEVVIVDHTMRSAPLCLEWTGMKQSCTGLEHVHLLGADQERMYQEVTLSGTRFLRKVKVLRAALKADVLINLPQMKSHSAATVSLGTKGNMGLIWDRSVFHSRMDLNEAIADLNTFFRAHLTILDGSRVLTAGGPQGPGPIEYPRVLIAGTDPIAVDAYGIVRVPWYGRSWRPNQVAHLAACRDRGLGEIDPDRIEVLARKAPAA